MTQSLNLKQKTRGLVKQRLHHAFQSNEKDKLDRDINENLRKVLAQLPLKNCAGFAALDDEPSLRETILSEDHLNWSYPKVSGDQLSFWKPKKFEDLKVGAWGILEPDSQLSEAVDLNRIEAVLIPGVAYDRSGMRLGRGKGFYDRALSSYQGHKIGVCYSFQIINEGLPVEEHDCCVNAVVTEKFVMWLIQDRAENNSVES